MKWGREEEREKEAFRGKIVFFYKGNKGRKEEVRLAPGQDEAGERESDEREGKEWW